MLEINGLTKKYGSLTALSGVELRVDSKGIFGIIGDRGSGKTTLSRMICGCEEPDSGEVSVDGQIMSRRALSLKRRVRLVPESLGIHGVSTLIEHLDFVGDALGVPPEKRYRQIKEALELLELDELGNKPFSSLTAAQRARLSIAASLIGNPDMIVLDTPFAGIEGRELEGIYSTLELLGGMKTLIITTRRPAEAKRLCDRIAILCDGSVVLSGSIADIEEKLNRTSQTYATVRGDYEAVLSAIYDIGGVLNVSLHSKEPNSVGVYSIEHENVQKINDRLFSALNAIGAHMLSVRSVTLTIDDVFYSFSSRGSKSEAGGEEATQGGRRGRK